MLSFSISYPNLIKFPYFANTIERWDKGVKAEEIGGETEGDFIVTLHTSLMFNHYIVNRSQNKSKSWRVINYGKFPSMLRRHCPTCHLEM
jgi:hypothetical protein